MSQELLKNCLHILNNSIDQHEDALQLLDLIIDGKWKDLSENERREVQQSVFKQTFNDALTLQVLYKVTAGELCSLPAEDTNHLLVTLAKNLEEEISDELVVHFSIKILINLLRRDPQNVVHFLKTVVAQYTRISSIINAASANPKLFNVVKDLMQLLSILFSTQHNIVVEYFFLDPIKNLRIPKILEF